MGTETITSMNNGTAETAKLTEIKVADIYKKRTGKMLKNEAKNKNKSMKGGFRKVSIPTQSIVSDTEHGAPEM